MGLALKVHCQAVQGNNMSTVNRLVFVLLTYVLIESYADAQPVSSSDLKALTAKCMDAQTPMQCRDAVPACERLVGILQKVIHSPVVDHVIAKRLGALAWCEHAIGRYQDAEQHSRALLALRKTLVGEEHVLIASDLGSLAAVLAEQGKYKEAEALLRQSLAMVQKLLGNEHPDVARYLDNLAAVLDEQGQYKDAETMYRQALAMRRKLLGSEHADVALSLNNLATLLKSQGQYREAEALCREGLLIRQKLLGNEHLDVAESLSALGSILEAQGKDDEARKLYYKALKMRQKLLGEVHPQIAYSLSNLAIVLVRQGEYKEAEELYRPALQLLQLLFGPDHPKIANVLNNLATALDSQGKFAEAETFYRQALAMQQKLLGNEHTAVANTLNNLAVVLEHQDKYKEAELLYRQALLIWQKLLGSEHPDVANTLNNLATCLLAQGQTDAAVPLLRQTTQIHEGQLRAMASETRMEALLGFLRGEENIIYGLLLTSANPALRKLALTLALLRKGRAAEAGIQANRLLHRHRNNAKVQQLFQQWQHVRQQREALLYRGLGALKPEDHKAQLEDLKLQAESLEAQVSVALPEFRALQPPDFDEILPAVAKRLPKDGLLIEFVWAKPFQANAKTDETRWSTPHLVAILLLPNQEVAVQDLGEAAQVDDRVRKLREALESSTSDPVIPARALYDQILAPLQKQLTGHTHLYLSPDGTLNLVPFDALHDGQDYLLGRYEFHYLTSGRDLLQRVSEDPRQPALILANPDFGQAASAEQKTLYQRLGKLSRLPGTEREARAIGPLLRGTTLLARRAGEEAVRRTQGPWVLHIATHGLFLEDTDLSVPLDARGMRSLSALPRSKKADLSPTLADATAESLVLPGGAGPLSRSALVLAGAARGERAANTAQDGLLTAEEARSLDLNGTQLVVLSACETGKGALSAGQGVYGLRRAFLVAGAETLVTSLWRVHDEATGELMELYYRKLIEQKQGRLAGMRAAMQELRRRPDRSHPYYWAPFLVIGQDGPLLSFSGR